MSHLMLVDDEPIVVDTIAESIDWEKNGFTEIFRAYSSGQAEQIAMKHRIDVLLSDMFMPGDNGIILADTIRTRWPDLKVIYLTGHEEFDYLKQALDIGASSYLLKPVDFDEIEKAVMLALKKQTEEINQRNRLKSSTLALETLRPMVLEHCFSRIVLQGTGKLTDELAVLAACGIRPGFDPMMFGLLILSPDTINDPDPLSEAGIRGLAPYNLISLAKKNLFPEQSPITLIDGDGDVVFVFGSGDEERVVSTITYISEMITPLQQIIQQELHLSISAIWEGPGHDPDLMNAYYRQMKQRMSQSRLLASSNLISPERLFQPIWHFDRNRFAKVLDTLDQRLIMESVRIEIASMAKTSVDSEMILRLYFEIGNILLNKGVDHLSDSSLEREQFIRHLYNFGNMASPEELLSWSSQIISIWCSIMTQKRNGTINSFTTATRNYIEKNFARNLSLTEIADYLHIHPNYLSKLFHEKEGMTITEYVQKCRMEKALELLKVTGIKVYEVADQIGYASLSHFIRVFKKTYGLNPKNWQSST